MKSWTKLALPLLFLLVFAFAFLAAPLSAQPRWRALGPYGGSINSLTAAPSNASVVYAVIYPYEGLFRSVDGGLNWTPIHGGIVEGNVAVDARRPDTVYASFSGRPWKSVDGGATWTYLGQVFEETVISVVTLLADPVTPSRVYAGTTRGTWRSDDGGATWQPPQSGDSEGTYHLTAAVRRAGVVLYAGTTDGLQKSLDAGRTWSSTGTQGLPGGGVVLALAAAPSDPQTAYACFADNGCYRTRDGGETWQLIGDRNQRVFSLAVSSRRPKELWIGTDTGLFRSLDGGDRWIPTAAPKRLVRALAAAPSAPRTLYMGVDLQALDPGGVFATTNGGRTWTQRNRGLAGIEAPSVVIDPQNSKRLWTGTSLLSLQRSDRGGRHWAQVPLPSAPRRIFPVLDVVMAPSAPSTLYVATYRALWRTRDGGATWTDVSAGAPRTQRPTALVVDPANPDLLWSLGDRLMRSVDGGETWSVAQGLEQACPFRSLAYAPSSPSTLYAGTSRPEPAAGCGYGKAVLFRSTDGGVTWTETATVPDGGSIADLDVDPVDPRLVYAVAGFSLTDALGLWRSDDGGATWNRLPGMAERITSLTLSPLSDVLWASTLAGPVIRGTDRGEHWGSRDEGLTASFVYELVIHPIDPNRIFAATSGGVWVLEDEP